MTCKKCLKKIKFEFSIKDEIWNKLPEKWRDSVLCFDCFIEELEKEVPNQKISLNDFYFLAICGKDENKEFGGVFLSTEYRKNKVIYLD